MRPFLPPDVLGDVGIVYVCSLSSLIEEVNDTVVVSKLLFELDHFNSKPLKTNYRIDDDVGAVVSSASRRLT